MTQMQGWSQATHQRVGTAIRNARRGRRMSAQDLADETIRLGHPISRSQIANYESGRKHSLDVTELLIFATALDIPPALLLFPTFPEEKVEAVPGQVIDTRRAISWLAGDCGLELGSSNAGTELIKAVARQAKNDFDLFQLRAMEPLASMPTVVESLKRVTADREEQSIATQAEIKAAMAALWGSVDE